MRAMHRCGLTPLVAKRRVRRAARILTAFIALVTKAGVSTRLPREIASNPSANVSRIVTYGIATVQGRDEARHDAGKADDAQNRDAENRAGQHRAAALARRARRAEIGECDDDECERVERREDPVVQLGPACRQVGRQRRVSGSSARSIPRCSARAWTCCAAGRSRSGATGRRHSGRRSRWSDRAGSFPCAARCRS